MVDLKGGEERPQIYDSRTLETWYRFLPRDFRRRRMTEVVSTRAALRVLPLIAAGTASELAPSFTRSSFVAFWALAVARAKCRYPSNEFAVVTRAVDAIDTTLNSIDTLEDAPEFTVRAARAAANAVNANDDAIIFAVGHAANAAGEAYTINDVFSIAAADRGAINPSSLILAAAARDDIWQSTSIDIETLEKGRSSRELANDPLWPRGQPEWAQEHWAYLRELLATNHWQPWVDWYQRCLDGEELTEEIELSLATLPIDPQAKDPVEQNALLAQEIARLTQKQQPRERPKIPEPKSAAVEPISDGGKIRLRKKPASADLDARALNASLRALKRQFTDLVESLDGESNIDRRATASLRRLANQIPAKRPTQEQLFRLAHEQEKLEAYASSVVEEWPHMLAADYLAATRAFDRTVRQFPSWRQFKANAEKDRLTAEQREETPRIAAEFAEALREDEAGQFVEQEIAAIVSEMASRLVAQREAQAQGFDPIATGADLLAEDLVASIDNILKAIAEAAISTKDGVAGVAKRAGENFASHAEKSIVKEAGKLGDGVGPTLTKWAKRTLRGAQVASAGYAGVKTGAITLVIQKLMHQFPQIEEWLRPILDFLS